MTIINKKKTIFLSIISTVAIIGLLSSFPSVSAGSGASANASMHETDNYLRGGVIVMAGHDFVPGPIRAYFELYRDGTFQGSTQAESTNYYLANFAAANITDNTHSQSGLYTMTWSGRVGGYYWNGNDWTDSGKVSYIKK